MAIETNGTDRVPLIKDPAKVFDIFNANDFLKAAGLTAQVTAPDGVLRTPLLENTRYIVHATFALPKLLFPVTTNTITASATELVGAQARSRLLVNEDNDGIPVFWGREVNQIVLTDLGIVDIGNSGAGQSATLFDAVGGSRASRLTFTNVTFARIADLGEATDFTLSFNPNVNLVAVGRGFVFDVSPFEKIPSANAFLAWRLINAAATAMESPYLGFTGSQVTSSINSGTATMSANDEFLRIGNNNSGIWDVVGNSYNGIGTFFSTGNVASNTLYANADLVIDSFSDSTVDPGVDTTVNLAAITKFKRGQKVLIADEAAYDGEHVIVRVASDQLSFDINVVFSTSGAGTLKQTRITSASHGFMLNEIMTISGTVGYDGETVINQIVDNDTYEIPYAFAAAEVIGTATSVAKTETSKFVTAFNNGEQKNSATTAEGFLENNALVTDIPAVDAIVIINASTWTGVQEELLDVGSDGSTIYSGLKTTPVIAGTDISLSPATSTKTLQARIAGLHMPRMTVTFTNGTNLINETGTTLIDGDIISFHSNTGTLPAELRDDILYYVVSQATNSFQVSYTSGGAAITFTDDGSGTNGYLYAMVHGSGPKKSIASTKAEDISPKALIELSPSDQIVVTISNKTDAVDITCDTGYIRIVGN